MIIMRKLGIFAALLLSAGAAQAVPAVWESDFGTAIVSGDDAIADGTLGFAFPFFGSNRSNFTLSTNGFVQFDGNEGSGCCIGDVPRLLSGAPRIAAQWNDLVGTAYLNTATAGRAVFTWQASEYAYGGSFTSQAQLFADGRIILGFNGPSVIVGHISLTGVSVGGGASDPGNSNLGGSAFSTGAGQSAYEQFGSASFDLNQHNVFFTPNGLGGVNVSIAAPSGVPEPQSWILLIGGFGAVGAMARRSRQRVIPT